MSSRKLTALVKDYILKELSFDLVGIAGAGDPGFAHAPAGHKPAEYLPGAKAVVVGGREVLDEILATTPSTIYCKHYEQLNMWLDEMGDQISRFLRSHGYKAMWFPESDDYNYLNEQRFAGMRAYSPCFSHIAAAVAAGLGVRGKVGVVLTPQYGPRQRWISVVTTAPLVPDPKIEGELCLDRIQQGSCGDKCIEACRTYQSGALRPWPEGGGVNMFRCNWGRMKGRGLSCGMCIKVCPVGKR